MRQSFLYFVCTHFRIVVRRFLVRLRTVFASPQKLARCLQVQIHSKVDAKMSGFFSARRGSWEKYTERAKMGGEV